MAVGLQLGETVDRYVVESLLGEGGMAAVYAVRHKTLGSIHALKILKVESRMIRERLVSEGQAQAALRHPNIVTVTDVLDVGGKPALLMELVDGPSLDLWLAENRPDVPDALRLFRGILAGVARAHRAGFVHRDLKPGNVLLDSADGMIIPKVADFGLAKALYDQASHAQTRTGLTMGTPQFMAPEQIRSAKDVDPRADIFALGCILYVLVTGRLPFESDDLLELYNRIAGGRYTPPQTHVPDLPPHVVTAIVACLEVDREARPADCDALRRMLYGDDDALAGGVRLAGVEGVRPRPPRPAAGASPRTWEDRSVALPVVPARTTASELVRRSGLNFVAVGVVGASLVVVAAIVGGVGWLLVEPPVEAVAPVVPPAVVPPAVVPPEPVEVVEVRTVEAAPGSPALPVGAPGPRPAAGAASPTLAPEASPSVAPAEPSETATGGVIINSRPYSSVFVDDLPRGSTSFRGQLPDGAHRVRLVRPDGAEHAFEATVVAGQTTAYCWNFDLGAECTK